jgi:hypothetical protein
LCNMLLTTDALLLPVTRKKMFSELLIATFRESDQFLSGNRIDSHFTYLF